MISIYKIVCLKNNRVYIGQTVNLKNRKQFHIYQLKNNIHQNPWLQEDYNKYGNINFQFSVLECVENKEDALKRETYWMNYYGGVNSNLIYNVKGNGKGQDNKEYAKSKVQFKRFDNFKGHKHTKQSKLKTSNTLKRLYREGKRVSTLSGKAGKDNSFYRKHHTEETKKHLSEIHSKMRKYSENEIDLWISDYNSGCSYETISKKYNCSIHSVKYIIHNKEDYLKYGLNNKPKKRKCND